MQTSENKTPTKLEETVHNLGIIRDGLDTAIMGLKNLLEETEVNILVGGQEITELSGEQQAVVSAFDLVAKTQKTDDILVHFVDDTEHVLSHYPQGFTSVNGVSEALFVVLPASALTELEGRSARAGFPLSYMKPYRLAEAPGMSMLAVHKSKVEYLESAKGAEHVQDLITVFQELEDAADDYQFAAEQTDDTEAE